MADNKDIITPQDPHAGVRQLGVRVEESLYRQMKMRAAEMGLRDWEVWEYAGWAWLKKLEDVSRET